MLQLVSGVGSIASSTQTGDVGGVAYIAYISGAVRSSPNRRTAGYTNAL